MKRPSRRNARTTAWPAADAGPAPDEHTPPAGYVTVVLHDVAPAHWAGCARVLGQLRTVAADAGVELPLTLLVVPRLDGVAHMSRHYQRWLQRQAAAGHELMLHGLTHVDDGPAPRNWRERLLRRHYTDGEGEFAALDRHQAAQRIARARTWAREQGLAMKGFVAPAWLMSNGSWDALRMAGFTHTCTIDRVIALPQGQALPARSLVFSTRSVWRRSASVLWNSALAWQQQRAGVPLMRFELHPGDCDHAAVRRCWTRLLAQALRERQPLRMAEAAALARDGGTPPARGGT